MRFMRCTKNRKIHANFSRWIVISTLHAVYVIFAFFSLHVVALDFESAWNIHVHMSTLYNAIGV